MRDHTTTYPGERLSRLDGPGKIAETIAWLVSNRQVELGPRFLVHGNATEWAASVGTREGLPATILDAIGIYLTDELVRRLVGEWLPFGAHRSEQHFVWLYPVPRSHLGDRDAEAA